MNKRVIGVVTGGRAEYGLLAPLIKKIKSDQALELRLYVTAMHLSPQHGNTYKIIENDGYTINEKVEMLISSDKPEAIAKSIGLGMIGFADAFRNNKPDILVMLGDRYELLSSAIAAMIQRIPIAHLHGGESTEGLIDEAIRHSITKMSHFHFVSTDKYRKRIIQMGENPEYIYNVGAIGLDNIRSMKLMTRDELEQSFDIKFGKQVFLVTYHPVTLESGSSKAHIHSLLSALNQYHEATIIFTQPNADTDSNIIADEIRKYVYDYSKYCRYIETLGQIKYLSMCSVSDAIIGNSSSGIIEVPSFHVPTVNIGDRQKGRLMPASVINCSSDEKSIKSAIDKALDREFKASIGSIKNPYGDGNTADKIIEILKKVGISDKVLKKSFFDLNCQ